MRLGQPTLSAQLKQLEETFGVKLFDRKHKRLLLTEQGRVALEYAKSIFKLGNEMYEVLNDRLIGRKVHLQVGALDSVPKQVMLQLSQAAIKADAGGIVLLEGRSEELLAELMAHRIDLLVTNYLPISPTFKGLKWRSLIKKSVGIYGHSKFKGLRAGFPKSLNGQKFILPTFDSKLRHDFDHWLRLNNFNIEVVCETQDISLKKLMAVEGMGLIPGAPYKVTRQVLGGELIEIGSLPGLEEELFLVSSDRKKSNPVAQQLMKSFQI